MLRMFRRVRRGRSHRESEAGDNNATDVDRRLPPRAPPGAISLKASAQWWRGAISGAIAGAIAVLVLVGVVTLLARKNTSLPPPRPPMEEVEVDQDHERCPVYNAVTGETTVPSEDVQAKRKVKILPNQEYPIESMAWADRVVKAKEARSREPKGAKPEQIGRAALSKRFEESGEKTPPLESGGVGAVLTLVDDDVSKPEQLLAVLGWTGWADGVGGMGAEATIEGEAWQEVIMCQDLSRRIGSSLDGAEREVWQRALDIGALKTVSCQTPTGDRLAGELSLACAAAEQTSAEWLWVPGAGVASAVANWGPEAGAKVVEELSSVAKTPNVEGVFGLRGWVRNKPPPQPLQRWDGHPRRRLHAAEPTEQPLYSGTIDPWVTSDDDEFPLPGEAAASVQRRRRSLKLFSLRAGAGETAWKFVGGVNLDATGKQETGDDEAGVVEVDALTEAVFVRASHLQHACAFISAATAAAAGHGTPETGDGGRHILRRGLGPAEQGPLESTGGEMPEEADKAAAEAATAAGTTPSPIVGVVNLSAISYVLRRTLGVRSFVKGGVLSWVGGEKPFGNGVASVFDGRGAALGDGEVSVRGSELLPWDCLSPSTSEAVLLAVTGMEDLRSLKPLLKEFQKSEAYDPYLVLSTPSTWAGSPDIERELETVAEGVVMTKFGVCGMIDLERVTSMASDSQAGARSLEEAWALLLGRLSPVAVIAIQHRSREGFGGDEEAWGGGGAGDTEKERAARRACARAEAQTAFIAMPPGDATHALWLPRLAPEALASWARPRFSASLITNARPASLARLLGSLKCARVFGDELAVDFYVESSADDETLRLVEAFSSEWGNRGPVQTHFRVLKGGLIRAVTESFYPSDRHHHAFLLEDDVEISPHFYAWAKWATLTYQYGRASDFLRDMYGVSLYTPRVDELSKKRQVYDSNKMIASKTSGVLFSPYLHQLPCSWGAVFFPETWMEYRLYLAARLREDHISVNIDGSRTNNWNTSWKRFFIEMAYQAQYYMLYPNFFNQTSFSTNWLEVGEHIKVEVKKTEGDKKGAPSPSPPPQTKGDKAHLPKDYTVPLMEDSASLMKSLPEEGLPSLKHLPRLDILNRDMRAHRSFH